MRPFFIVLLCEVILGAARVAQGAWVADPIDARIIESDVIVSGKIVKIKEGPTVEKKQYSLGELQVADVYKGESDLKKVEVAFAAKPAASDVVYKQGQEGIWILKRDSEGDYYWATSPLDLQPKSRGPQIEEGLKHLEVLDWGPETDGVQLLLQGMVAQDVPVGMAPQLGEKKNNTPALAVFLKNASEKPIWVCDYAGDRPVKLNVTSPSGKPVNVQFYAVDWRQPLSKSNYLRLLPGQVRKLGGAPGVFKLQLAQFVRDTGQYTISATYTAKRDGKALKLDDVWKGTVTSGELKFTVKAAPAKGQ
jgi:hypothetical protein